MLRGLAAFLLLATSAPAGPLKAGAATVDITPPPGAPLWGYAARRDAPSTGVCDRLFARCLVLDDGDARFAIVSLDLGRAPPRAVTARIRDRLRVHSFNHILLVASHTHHGPVLELDDSPNPQNPYNRFLENALVEIITRAGREAVPARFGVEARESRLNRNRHSKRPDAPVDRTLTVMRVETTEGKPVATVVNFAAHPTMRDAKLLQWSADWPGALARRIERNTGAPCLFLQGAAGDLSPHPQRKASPEEFGEDVAVEATGIWKSVRCETVTTRLRGHRETFRFPCVLDVGNPLIKLALGRAFFPALVGFYESEYRDGVRPEMSVLAITPDFALVGFSGEMFCGHALSLRRRARIANLMVCGYANDYQQYFPTIEAMSEGGYGSAPPVAMCPPGSGEQMTDRALVELYRLRGLLP